MTKAFFLPLALIAGLVTGAPAAAQIERIDPNDAAAYENAAPPPDDDADPAAPAGDPEYVPLDEAPPAEADAASPPPAAGRTITPPTDTIPRDDVFSAAEGVFGKGAAGLGKIVEDILKDQGEPVAYIAGQEASGAFVVGLRYGSGTMRHQVEGDRAVFWTGPSVGFDAGADANKVFVLVYNLYDSHALFRRYPAAEGRLYAVGGFTASYLRRGDVVLIPVRLGVGLRAGANIGYMKFSEKSEWMPF